MIQVMTESVLLTLIYRKYLIKIAFGNQFPIVIIMYYRNESHSGYS